MIIILLESKVEKIIERKVQFYIANKAIDSIPSIVLFKNEINLFYLSILQDFGKLNFFFNHKKSTD